MIHYFVSYTFTGPGGGIGFANADVPMTKPIRNLNDVAAIKQWLASQGLKNPVVLSFCPFDSNTVGGPTR